MSVPAPRENPDLVGHEAAEHALLEAFLSGRLHHAWLLCGPRGIGKATLAFRFARFLFQQAGSVSGVEEGGGLFGPAPPAPAPTSLYVAPDQPVFRRVESGGHVDLFTLERAVNDNTGKLRSEIVIGDVRRVKEFMTRTAGEGGWRIVIVDGADEMNRNAANGLLKVLEEPPERALLLLVAHQPGRLLPTIRSRCRKLALSPLDSETATSLLLRHDPSLNPADAAILARLAEGSVGRALELAAEGGLEFHRTVRALLAGLPDLDVAALHDLGERVNRAGSGDGFRTVADLVRWWLGRLIVFAARRGDLAGLDQEERAVLARLASAASPSRWLETWDRVGQVVGRGEGLNMERKQMVLSLFFALRDAMRS